jgi:aminomethyltransferase
MLETPLHQHHIDHGGKMVDFAGWDMPLYYKGEDGTGSIVDEHNMVRTCGGVFDVSHMGRLRLKGRDARRLLERACSRRIHDMQEGQCRYTLICNETGGVKDDALVYRMSEDEFLFVVNGSNREKITDHLESIRGDLVCELDDRTMKTAMIAIQGPEVMALFSNFSQEIPALKRFRFAVKNLMIMKLVVSRTGYTGEDGVEIILPAKMVNTAMKLMAQNVDPKAADSPLKGAGLGARDTLRMEAAMPLYGHELGEDINALEVNMPFAITMDKDEHELGEPFFGQAALKQTIAEGGPKRQLVGLLVEGKRTARQHMPVLVGGKPRGVVTSACVSPTLGQPIAMAYLDKAHIEPGTKVEIDTGRADKLAAEVCALPFYKATKK